MILIVSLFVMLCSHATYARGRMIEIQKSFRAALSALNLNVLFSTGQQTDVRQPAADAFTQERIAAPLQKFLKGKGFDDEVFLKSTQDMVHLTLLDTVLFLPGSTQLSPRAQALLGDLARLLRDFSMPLRIEGHTDDLPPGTSATAANWSVSALKAMAVMSFIRDACGIPQQRLSAAGFSEFRPFVPNTSADERRRNRRVELLIPVDEDFISARGGIIKESPPSFKIWDLRAQED
jgi:chemotaxis protein MotB